MVTREFGSSKAMLADLLEDDIFALKQLPSHMEEGRRGGSRWLVAEKRNKHYSKRAWMKMCNSSRKRKIDVPPIDC